MTKRKEIGSYSPIKRPWVTTKRPMSVHLNGEIIGYVKDISYEEQYPRDTLFHPSSALKRLEKMIKEEDYNPSRRKQRNIEQILDNVDFDNENDT